MGPLTEIIFFGGFEGLFCRLLGQFRGFGAQFWAKIRSLKACFEACWANSGGSKACFGGFWANSEGSEPCFGPIQEDRRPVLRALQPIQEVSGRFWAYSGIRRPVLTPHSRDSNTYHVVFQAIKGVRRLFLGPLTEIIFFQPTHP